MAKTGTLEHKKTKKLAKLLKLPNWAALGLLEAFWHWVGKYCGNGLLETDDFESCAETIKYQGKGAKELVKILAESGWIEPIQGGFYVHDWHDHAPDYVKKNLSRKGLLFANGHPPYGAKVSGQSRDNVGTESSHDPETGETLSRSTNLTKPNLTKPNLTASATVVPSPEQIALVLKQLGRRSWESDGVRCWNHWDAMGWLDSKGNRINNWRSAVGWWNRDNVEPPAPKPLTKIDYEALERA